MTAGRTPIYHGTHLSHAADIRELGIPAIPEAAVEAGAQIRPPVNGVRVRLKVEEARKDARAYAAAHVVAESRKPEGIIVAAIVSNARIFRVRDMPRVSRIMPEELTVYGPIKFPEFDPLFVGRATPHDYQSAHNALDEALEDFKRLTARRLGNPFPITRGR